MAQERQVQIWWVPGGHQGIAGNEHANSAARAALEESRTTGGEFFVSRAMLEGAIRQRYQGQVRSQERSTRGMILEPTEEVIIHTELDSTEAMHSSFMAAWVGQFLIGHFPTGVLLHRFGHLPSPFVRVMGCQTRGATCFWTAPIGPSITSSLGSGFRVYALQTRW